MKLLHFFIVSIFFSPFSSKNSPSKGRLPLRGVLPRRRGAVPCAPAAPGAAQSAGGAEDGDGGDGGDGGGQVPWAMGVLGGAEGIDFMSNMEEKWGKMAGKSERNIYIYKII